MHGTRASRIEKAPFGYQEYLHNAALLKMLQAFYCASLIHSDNHTKHSFALLQLHVTCMPKWIGLQGLMGRFSLGTSTRGAGWKVRSPVSWRSGPLVTFSGRSFFHSAGGSNGARRTLTFARRLYAVKDGHDWQEQLDITAALRRAQTRSVKEYPSRLHSAY